MKNFVFEITYWIDHPIYGKIFLNENVRTEGEYRLRLLQLQEIGAYNITIQAKEKRVVRVF